MRLGWDAVLGAIGNATAPCAKVADSAALNTQAHLALRGGARSLSHELTNGQRARQPARMPKEAWLESRGTDSGLGLGVGVGVGSESGLGLGLGFIGLGLGLR